MPHNDSPDDVALIRIGIDVNDIMTISVFQELLIIKLRGQGKIAIDAWTNVFRNLSFNFPKYEVKPVNINPRGEAKLRYILPGIPGFWTYSTAVRFVEEQIRG